VRAAHGTLPVPAPATLRLLEGVPVRVLEIEGELTTPTGAALITSLCDTIGEPVGMRLQKTAVATGTRDVAERPNIVRALLGDALDSVGAGSVDAIEATIDDMNPQLYGHLTESLFESGALEVYLTPVQMKKGRPGVLVTALCDPRRTTQVAERLFGESTTLGLRVRREGRMELRRSINEVVTPLGTVRVKTAVLPNGVERRVPEYDDLRRLARESGKPLVEVMETVRAFLAEGAGAPIQPLP
jgi:pyridinium-3,5-bisthiocarboxylic acid mononucleotide nickel chelatase